MRLSKKIIIILTAVLVLLIGGGIAYATITPNARAERQLKLADKYLQEGKYQEAILAYSKLIEIEPKNIQARISLSKAYIAINQVEKAEQELKKGIDLNAEVSELYLELANLYITQNNIDDAIRLLEQGYSITSDVRLKMLLDESMEKRDKAAKKPDNPQTQEPTSEEKKLEIEPIRESINTAPKAEIAKEVPKQEPTKTEPAKEQYVSKYQRFSGGFNVRLCNSEELLELKSMNPTLTINSAAHFETVFSKIEPSEYLNRCYFLGYYLSKEPITDKLIEDYWNQNELYNSRATDKSNSFANKTNSTRTGQGLVFEGKGSYYAAEFYLDENGQIVGINYYPGTIEMN